MRQSFWVAVAASGLACGWGGEVGEVEALPEGLAFAEPDLVDVQRGDTLSAIADRHGCDVDDLMAWNSLESDRIEVGDRLVAWPVKRERARPKVAGDRPRSQPKVAAAKPMPKPWNPLQRLVEGPATEAPEPAAEEVDERVASIEEKRPIGLRLAGILGADVEGSDTDLEASARGMRRHDSALDGSGLDARGGGLADGGQADSVEIEQRQPGRYGGVQIPDTPVQPPRLARPAAKRCLAGPSEADLRSDQDMAANQGLSSEQIRAGMSKVIRASTACFPAGSSGDYTVIVELRVGCDGLVADARTVSAGVVPARVTGCIDQTMTYAGFAPHAVPNGVVFQYPLTYSL